MSRPIPRAAVKMDKPADATGATGAAGSSADDSALAGFLAERDAPCPNCHYNLRGLTTPTCPECGLGLALRVNLVEPRLAAWLCGLVGLNMSLGWSGLFLLFGLGIWVSEGWTHNMGPVMSYFTVGTLVSAGLVWLWLDKRPVFRQQSATTRRGLAAACWLVPTINLCVFPLVTR